MALAFLSIAAAEEAKPPASIRELDERLSAAFRDVRAPGGAVAIVENGQVVFVKGYGLADREGKIPVTPDTVFRAGSISKSLTGIAIMTLVEQGKLSLDARLMTLAPEVKFVNPWEATDPVRLVHLLEHTTGWPDISLRVLTLDGKGWSLLRGIQETSPEFVCRWRPGYFAVYNNAGPAVAGYVLEKASGQSFDAYLRDHVLRPMGMSSADFDLPPELAARLAKSYESDGTPTPYQYIILPPAGSLAVSVRELAQLILFHLGRGTVDGRQILTPQSVERIERSESNSAARFGFTNGYGLGNAPLPDKGVSFHGHNGGIDSFTSVYGYSVETASGYVLMANGGDGVDFATPISRLAQEYLARNRELHPPPDHSVDVKELERYAGVYRNITPPNSFTRPYTELLGLTRTSVADGMLRISGNVFHPTGPHSFRRFDREAASLAFFEEGGNVYKVSAFYAAQKEPVWRVMIISIIGIILVLGTLISVVMIPLRLVLRLFGRSAGRGGVAVRALPPAAILAMLLTFVLPLLALSSGMTWTRRLADVSPLSILLLVCSVLYPLLALAGLRASARAQEASRVIRLFACAISLAVLAVAVYAAWIGWLPLMSWKM